jgi:hypothetical protein
MQREKRGKLSRNLGGGKKRKTLTGKREYWKQIKNNCRKIYFVITLTDFNRPNT